MFDDSRSFISRAYLQSIFDIEFKAYLADGTDAKVLAGQTARAIAADRKTRLNGVRLCAD